MNEENHEQKNYRIDFVDPEEIIDFIEEDPEEENALSAEIDEEIAEEPDLPYTNQIAEEASEYIEKRKEDTRGRLAVIYVISTFTIFGIVILVAVLDGLIRRVSIIENLMTVLPMISGFFLGTLGFVLGYYFKSEQN